MSDAERPEVREAYLSGVMEARAQLEGWGVRPFDSDKWRLACREISKLAAIGCGLSDVVWQRRATSSMRPLLRMIQDSGDFLELATAIAQEAGYLTEPEERRLQEELAEDGLCSHGLDESTCPCGCFEYD